MDVRMQAEHRAHDFIHNRLKGNGGADTIWDVKKLNAATMSLRSCFYQERGSAGTLCRAPRHGAWYVFTDHCHHAGQRTITIDGRRVVPLYETQHSFSFTVVIYHCACRYAIKPSPYTFIFPWESGCSVDRFFPASVKQSAPPARAMNQRIASRPTAR